MEFTIGGILAILFIVFVEVPFMKSCDRNAELNRQKFEQEAPLKCEETCKARGATSFTIDSQFQCSCVYIR